MAKTARNLTVVAVMVAVALATPMASLASDAPVSAAPPMSHIRTADAKVAAVVQTAFDRSVTFRKMVAIIDASDSYVYVQAGTLQPRCQGVLRQRHRVGHPSLHACDCRRQHRRGRVDGPHRA